MARYVALALLLSSTVMLLGCANTWGTQPRADVQPQRAAPAPGGFVVRVGGAVVTEGGVGH